MGFRVLFVVSLWWSLCVLLAVLVVPFGVLFVVLSGPFGGLVVSFWWYFCCSPGGLGVSSCGGILLCFLVGK